MAEKIVQVCMIGICLMASLVAGARQQISSTQVTILTRYAKLSTAAYQSRCLIPPGNATILATIIDRSTDTFAYVAQDHAEKEIIVALRGTSTFIDIQTDLNFPAVTYRSPGINDCRGCKVHAGFLRSWNAVADGVIDAVMQSLRRDPNQKVTVTGHSLGAALASLAAMSIIGSGAPQAKAVNFGQPRTGNRAYADYVDRKLPTFIRVTHSNDGVPQVPLVTMGFRHHATEYWQENKPQGTTRCDGQEPKDCVNSRPPVGPDGVVANSAHLSYMGVVMGNFPGAAAVCGQRDSPFQIAKTLTDFFGLTEKRSVPLQS